MRDDSIAAVDAMISAMDSIAMRGLGLATHARHFTDRRTLACGWVLRKLNANAGTREGHVARSTAGTIECGFLSKHERLPDAVSQLYFLPCCTS
ncbi:hypothetical protein M8818_002366 [Zalaria obscura]|uniref:Uncharacterized protein n=1 Tax=Zalaria obscura TaxID=2024903 RepID=A0ACC3SI67_9PEZI